jgi:hypothetical protein
MDENKHICHPQIYLKLVVQITETTKQLQTDKNEHNGNINLVPSQVPATGKHWYNTETMNMSNAINILDEHQQMHNYFFIKYTPRLHVST